MAPRFLVHPAGRRARGRKKKRLELPLKAQLGRPRGYVVAPCPIQRGSTGFRPQKYIDEISGEWGGKCYDDLMAGSLYLGEAAPNRQGNSMARGGP